MARWQAGDVTAFELLHRRFAPLLAARVTHSKIWPMLRGRFSVDDVVQEVWTRVVPAVKRSFTPAGPNSFLAFLATVADRTMVDLARRQSASKRGEGENVGRLDTSCEREGARPPGAGIPETPTSSARRTELEEIARVELSERELQAWELVELQGYSAGEAALALACSDSAVRGLLLRARARLVRRLGEG